MAKASPGQAPRAGRKRARSRKSRSPLRRFLLRVAFHAAWVSLLAGAAALFWIDQVVTHRFAERTQTFASRVFAAAYTLHRGGPLDPRALEAQLRRRNYRETKRTPGRPGEFRRNGGDWDIYLRAAEGPGGRREASQVRVEAWWGKVRRIKELGSATALDEMALEPEPLFSFYGDVQEERRWTPLAKIPRSLIQAVEAVEDRRFRSHHGVDVVGIGRAFVTNVRAGETLQGGSTIPQQLVKNLLGPGPRTLSRKAIEAGGAITLEWRRSKDEILEAYLNEVYLGQRGPVAISGVGDASRFFFGMEVGDIDLARAALLAGIIQSPGRYNPWLHPQEAKGRRDHVLGLLRESGAIDDETYRRTVASGIGVSRNPTGATRMPWVEDVLAEEIRRVAPEALPSRAGFSIFTTFDGEIQRAAEGALADGLGRLQERRRRGGGPPLEGAVIVLRPSDGALLALVGGRDYQHSQFNRATDSRRPAGSTFKPFVYLAALERTEQEPEFGFTAATQLEDTPLEVRSGGRNWSPENYDHTFREVVTVRQALENSINVPTVRAALKVGLPAVVNAARRCGIKSELAAVPALALGAESVVPLELAAAYAPFANGGWRVQVHSLAGVLDRDGASLGTFDAPRVRAIDVRTSYLMTNLLEGVLTRGTGRSAAALGFTGHAAGKTGTSNDERDAWFIGYVPELLALVWVGYDDNRPVGESGAAAALPIWVDLLGRLGIDGSEPFEPPAGIVEVEVDASSGGLATSGCPEVVNEVFVAGTEPTEECPIHGGGARGFWRRLFRMDP